ncbi:MAG: hypothetical protein ACOCZ8_05235 [Bacteroidota bacterium]
MRAYVRGICALALALLAAMLLASCAEERPLIVWADRGADALYGEAIAAYQAKHPDQRIENIEYSVYTSDFLDQSVKLGRPVDVVLTASQSAIYRDWQTVALHKKDTVLLVRFTTDDTACCLLPEDGHLAAPAARRLADSLPCTHTALHPEQLHRFLENGQYDCGILLASDMRHLMRPNARTQTLQLLRYKAFVKAPERCSSCEALLQHLNDQGVITPKKSPVNVAPSAGKP